MAYNTIEVPFTNELRKWLISIGYTHMLHQDVFKDPAVEENENDPYVVIPLRPLDQRFKIANNKVRIERITSNDTVDMSTGYPYIRFAVILPTHEFEDYLKL